MEMKDSGCHIVNEKLAGEALGYFQFSGGESNNVWSRL